MKYCYIFLILLPFLGFSQVQIGTDIIGSFTENWAGFSVSMNEDGSRMAVGAPKYNSNQGQVKIYEFSGNDWVQLGNTILGEKQFDFAGWDISLSSSGNRIAIGSYTGGTTYSQGQVRIFELNSGVWVQLGNSLNGDDQQNYFGQSVNLSGDGKRVVIGAPFNDLNGTVAGQVKVFEFDLNNWIQIGADILGEASQDRSGWDVSINETGNRIAMSAITTKSGHVRIFEFINGNWTLLGQKITGVSAYENSGTSISLDNSGNRIAIGNRLNSEVASSSGQVRIYEFSGGSWTQLGRDLNGNAKNDELGSSVSLSSDGNRLAVGAPNATAPDDSIGFVQVFEFLEGDWIPIGENLTGEVVKDEFGKSVGISGNGKRLVVGAPKYKNNVYKVGKVKVYDLNTVRITGISQDTGNSNTDGITKNQELIINGKAEANSIIEIFLNGISIGTTTVNAFGNWSFDYTGTTLEEGVYNLTAQATDTFNNTGPISKVFTIVIDITPPIITFPEDITQENDLNDCGAAITYEVTVNDNNQGATISSIPNSGSRFPLGKTVVNVLGTDVAGNIATNTFNVTVNDNEAPAVITKNITIPLGANGTITLLPSQINNGSSDNCEIAEITLSKTTFDCSNIGDNTVVLTVKDTNNNEASSTSVVTVIDTIAPTVATKNLNLQLVAGSITITPEDVDNNSSDNCEISSMSLNKTTFNCSNIGENTVTLTVTDTSGNSNSADAIITIDGIQTTFTSNENIVCRNTPVDFTDTSIVYGTATISSWNWDFGDGLTSTEQNPTHTFDLPGNYMVSLTTTDSNGCQNTFTSTIKINPPKADFTLNPATGGSTLHTVFFTDQSVLPDTWSWEFGDGSTSTAKNPIHTYTSFGDFTTKLTVTDTIVGCSDFTEKLVKIAKPNSNFTSNTQFGCGPLTVNFEDTSTVSGNDTIESWLWDFGDGTTSTEQNPTHIYENSGRYSVSLKTTLTTTGITNTNSKSNYIQVLGPNVNFTTTNTTVGCPDLTINFEDQTVFSSPSVSWTWDFGDGSVSNLQNPAHTYTTYGSYDVSLTVTDLDGCSRTLTKQAFVDTSDTIAPTAVCKPFTAALNTNGMVTISATAVDGGSTDNCKIASLTITPNTFTCANIGENTVTLTVTDENGNSTSETAIVTIEDKIAPIALTKDITIQLGENGTASISAEDVDNGSYDACGIKLLSLFPTNQSFDCSNIGENEVKLLVVDNSDNVTAAYATVTVVDTTEPTVSTQNVTVQLDANGTVSITVEDINNGSSDNCEIESMSIDVTSFDCTA
ncbi:PKD domain-containing protein, partial [Lutibacter maritimus]